MDPLVLRNLFYILAAILFILGIKGLTHPCTAVRGNMLGALGMLVAIVVTLIDKQMIGWWWIGLGLAIGTAIGAVLAVRIQMTAMPQLVALYNGFGGIAYDVVAGAVLHSWIHGWKQSVAATPEAAGSMMDYIAATSQRHYFPGQKLQKCLVQIFRRQLAQVGLIGIAGQFLRVQLVGQEY